MKTRHILSFLLAFCILLSSSIPAYASKAENTEAEIEILTLDDGSIYTRKASTQNVVVTIPSNSSQIEIDFSFTSNPDKVYQFYTSYDHDLSLANATSEDWSFILALCQSSLSSAKQIDFSVEDVTYEEPIDISRTRSSVAADLIEGLIELQGKEYEKLVVHSTTYQGQNIKVYQMKVHRIYEAGYKRWSTGEDLITLGAFITGVLGLTATATVLGVFSIVFGVLPSAASKISGSGRVDKYKCDTIYSRYTTVNNSKYVYTMTDEVYEYMGYDDNDIASTARAAIDSSDCTHFYYDSEAYYNSFSAQVQDAYNLFCRIGQQD